MHPTSLPRRRVPAAAGTALAAIGLAAVMWSASAGAQTTTTPPTTTTTPPGGVQPGVRPGTAAPTARPTPTGQAQDLSAREASVLRGPRSDQLEGVPLGSFVVHPRLALDVEFDDNVF